MLGVLPTFLIAAAHLAPEGGDAEIGRYRGDPLLPPLEALAVPRPSTTAAERGVVFVNFDGAVLTSAPEDARVDQTQIGFEGVFESYGTGAKREAVMQAVRADWAPYDIELTQIRPGSGDYTMAMVGPTNFTQGSLGLALLDCEDAWTHNNIVYAFHHIDDGYSAAATATTIGQEVAHSFGLEHVDDPADVMHPYNLGGDPAFLDDCIDIVPASFGILCDAQHERQCGSATAQNAHRELLDLFGGSGPDTTAPTVRIESPGDGDVFDVGATFEIAVFAADDEEVARVELRDGDRMFGADTEAPWGWQVKSASEGEYRFVVAAIDDAGNEAFSEEIVVAVAMGGDAGLPGTDGDPDPDRPDDDGDGSSDDGRDAYPDPDETESGDVGDSVGAVKHERFHAFDEPGCACRGAPGRRPASSLLLLLVLFGAVRRRSR
jgi:hypothetical protein